jgi:tripartite-type tricarboxylate transporter receptor subunit TctC
VRRRTFVALGVAAAGSPAAVRAQGAFPDRPVSLVCPFPPGGPLDSLLRTLAEPMARRLGQPVVVENRPGAGGGLALSARLRPARPDGHVVSLIGLTAFRQPLLERVDYDTRRDFAWVCMLTATRHIVVARADPRWRDWTALLAFARANPGAIRYGTPGVNTAPHIEMLRLARQERADWEHVPFRGDPEGVAALLGGQMEAMLTTAAQSALVGRGEARILGLMSADRLPSLPEVPTLREQGTDSLCEAPFGVVAPAGTPPAVVARLAGAFDEAMAEPETAALLARLNQANAFLGPEPFAAWAARTIEEQEPLLRSLGIALRQG